MRNPFDAIEKCTLLIVDDSSESLELLNGLLGATYQVRLAKSGEQALKAARQDPRPDLILLDIMMPDMNGYDVCALLKTNDATKEIPVIFLTAKNEIEDAQFAFDLGAADYITKPILPPVVLARVRTHLSLKLARDFLRAQPFV